MFCVKPRIWIEFIVVARQCLISNLTLDCVENNRKNAQRDTLRAVCSKAEPKVFAPPQTRFPGAQDGQNVISWRRSLPLPTNPVWWGSMHAISSYRGNRPTHEQTHKHTHKQTHRQDRLQYTAPLSLARSVTISFDWA